MLGAALLSSAALHTVPALVTFGQEMATRLKAFQLPRASRTFPWSWYGLAPQWVIEELNQVSPVPDVRHWVYSPLLCQFFEYDGVDNSDLKAPKENLPPPFDALVHEAVVATKLIKLVYTEHVLVIVLHYHRLLLRL